MGKNVEALEDMKKTYNQLIKDCITMFDIDFTSIVTGGDKYGDMVNKLAFKTFELLNKSFAIMETQAETLDKLQVAAVTIESKDDLIIEKLRLIEKSLDKLSKN